QKLEIQLRDEERKNLELQQKIECFKESSKRLEQQIVLKSKVSFTLKQQNK
ncbi:MAG: hypothetical protein MHPSP_002997, partial [Paramarteilia canceri]